MKVLALCEEPLEEPTFTAGTPFEEPFVFM